MIIALTGTPGIGKTSISKELINKGYEVIDLNKVVIDNKFFLGQDNERDSKIVDITKLNYYFKNNYREKDIVFVDGHLSHFLKCADFIIVLRLNPAMLYKNLVKRKWKKKKIKENLEAEMLDIILCETIEIHSKEKIIELNMTDKSIEKIVKIIMELVKNKFKNIKKYKIGSIDWSEQILKEF